MFRLRAQVGEDVTHAGAEFFVTIYFSSFRVTNSSEYTDRKPMLKSIAIVAGAYILSVILVVGTDPLVSFLFPGDFVRSRAPSNAALLTSTACFIVVSILCAWLCARLDSVHASRHVLWFFVTGEVMGIATTIPNWNGGWPHWYSLSWLLSWPVSCWIGLRLAPPDSIRPTAGDGYSSYQKTESPRR